MSSGVYMIRVGPAFYIGSSRRFAGRKSYHLCALKWGCHDNPRLQAAYKGHGTAEFLPLEYMKPDPGEELSAFSTRLRHAEQRFLDRYKTDPGLCNLSPSAFGPNNGALLKGLWRGDEYRERMRQAATGRIPTPETRERMSRAKRGFQNPKACGVIVTAPDGKETRFATTTDAAAFFRVSQQLFFAWLRGHVAWPGTGKRCKPGNEWIKGYSARVEG